ncbi:MAG: twin-arginine translocation signal domain-containing protein [Candidatus Symbiothrix sp.]|jgi:beta-lactamase superfamily II metal-dependent hydrolase|nr:twin-arginine translocation signal domain-containing protein [Candidatus Symbiothrix sp.]
MKNKKISRRNFIKLGGLAGAGFVFVPFVSGCGGDDSANNGDTKPVNPGTGVKVGDVLSDWAEGYLDIHVINTGRGESTLYIFPDGTTMLVDAAGSLTDIGDADEDAGVPTTPPKPNASITSGQVVVDYVNHFAKAASNKLNYLMLSHFHPDHMGSYSTSVPMATSGDFRLTGITEVGAKVKFDKLIDRGYPNYNFPEDLTTSSYFSTAGHNMMKNYIKFVNWAVGNGSTAEQFEVGRNDQLTLKQNPSKYSNFQIRNIVSNGIVWTGTGTGVKNTFPDGSVVAAATYKNENVNSIGFQLKYGGFDYFAGGDLQYTNRSLYAWLDIEKPVAEVVTAVDVMKTNHHCTSNCNSDVLVAKLKPRVALVHSWREKHPYPATAKRFYDLNCDLFSTCVMEANKPLLASYMSKILSTQGHIVVRVAPGGLQYKIYVLDDSNQEYIIKSISGPYQSA